MVRDHPRPGLALPLAPLDVLDAPLDTLRAEITRVRTDRRATPPTPPPVAPMTVARAVTVLDTSPGVNQRGGERLVAAWGIDMARVGTAARLAAWSGVAPGHDDSAGTQRSGQTRQGHRALRPGVTPLAHAAARPNNPDLSALSQRRAARRGKTRAIMAVAHSSVVRAFPRLSRHDPYQE